MKITSVNNELIKNTAKLLNVKYREESGMFLIEGGKGIEEALKYGLKLVHIFSVEGFENLPQRIEVTEPVLSKISDAKSTPKAVAVAQQPEYSWSDEYTNVILLEGIKDPGNLGTIIRTAAAFNVSAIVLYGDTVDLYNPKCVRSAVGNLWKVPVFKMNKLDLFDDFERIATLPNGNDTIGLKDYNYKGKNLIMFGSEADGLSDELKSFATKSITIEMNSSVESLNLSVSAGIIIYNLFN